VELVRLLEGIIGRESIIQWQPFQAGDVEMTYADIEKARRLIGYSPKTSLKEGLEIFVNWLRRTP
jgi:UDP-glucuronate 4-epimerase